MAEYGMQSILTVPARDFEAARRTALTIGHMAYRLGAGGALLSAGLPKKIQGGLMVLGDTGFHGGGNGAVFSQAILRECANRRYSGAIFDFEGEQTTTKTQIIGILNGHFSRRNLRLYIPEEYAHCAPQSHIMISSALSGGSLTARLSEAIARYGASRVALAVERAAEDFTLPAATGRGRPLTREELRRIIAQREPSVFFSNELCAHYFTYMDRESGAHFVLFDDERSLEKKLRIAQNFHLNGVILAYPQISDLLPALLPTLAQMENSGRNL